jgi:hypothetical protein
MGGGGANGASSLGQSAGAPGLHLVDGAALPRIPAKLTALTMMTSANRIGRLPAQRS